MSQPYRWPSLSERKSYLVSLLFFHGSICAVEESFYLHFLSSQFLSCLSRPYPFTFFKGSLPQILLGPFLNTFSHISQKILKLE